MISIAASFPGISWFDFYFNNSKTGYYLSLDFFKIEMSFHFHKKLDTNKNTPTKPLLFFYILYIII